MEKEDEATREQVRDDYRGGPGVSVDVRDGAFAVRMDVTDRESIDAAVSEVSSWQGN